MKNLISSLLTLSALMLLGSGCSNTQALADASFGKIGSKEIIRASSADVISMGRDDDDGKAKKWHIGGGID